MGIAYRAKTLPHIDVYKIGRIIFFDSTSGKALKDGEFDTFHEAGALIRFSRYGFKPKKGGSYLVRSVFYDINGNPFYFDIPFAVVK